MAPKNNSSSSSSSKPSRAAAHRVAVESHTISKTERKLHLAVADSYDKGLKSGKLEEQCQVTLGSNDVSEVLNTRYDLASANEKERKDYELAVWEGRFSDYLAFGLSKIETHCRVAKRS